MKKPSTLEIARAALLFADLYSLIIDGEISLSQQETILAGIAGRQATGVYALLENQLIINSESKNYLLEMVKQLEVL